MVHVFDVGQTEGHPIEDLDAVRPKLLDGEAPEGIWDALVAHAASIGFEVVRERKGSANGYCDFVGKKISVRPDVSAAQAVKTLVHELAHALLHGEDRPKTATVAEVEVESVAYIVCDALGLDTGDYSFAYVARWSGGETELLKATGERVVACARTMLDCFRAARPEGQGRGEPVRSRRTSSMGNTTSDVRPTEGETGAFL